MATSKDVKEKQTITAAGAGSISAADLVGSSVTEAEQGPAQMTFGQIMGDGMRRLIDAHGQQAALQAALRQNKSEITIWYHSQDTDAVKRKEIAQDTKKKLELARSVVESMYQEFMGIAYGDL